MITEEKEYSEEEEYFEKVTMNRVNKRGNANRKNEEGSEDGNNIEEEIELDTTKCSSDDS